MVTMVLGELTCGRCSKKVLKNEVKYDPSGSKLVCRSCSDFLCKKDLHTHERTEKKVSDVRTNADLKVNFVCMSCNYKFSLKKGSNHSLKCPFCDSTSVQVNDVNAYSILDEVKSLESRQEFVR
jgi:hypothetical protein